MNILRKASHVFVAGKSGKGKTSYAERYIVGSHHDRVFIFDHQGEFQHRLHVEPVIDFSELWERAAKERILCFDFSLHFPGELEDTFDQFCATVFELSRYYLQPAEIETLFVCDEIQKVTGPFNAPKPLKDIMQTGRRYALDSLTMSQAPNEVHNTLRNQITELVLFNLVEENSLKFAANLGIDVSQVLELPDLTYNWYNLASGEQRLRQKIVYPAKHY